mgnify:CR=1 FL=1
MTSRPERVPLGKNLLPGLAAVALFVLMAAVFVTADTTALTQSWGFPQGASVVGSIGAALIGIESAIPTESFVVALLIIAIALDAALDGALMLAKREEDSGGEPMAESGHFDDVDYLLAVHIGLDHPSGEIVAGIDGFLAVSQFEAEFEGAPAHAGIAPETGRNAMQAAAAAIQNLYGISRHAGGATRVNVGVIEGGTATNIVPERVAIEGEVRGDTTELMEYMDEKARRVLRSAAEMHDCEVDVTTTGRAPSTASDRALAALVGDVARTTGGVTSVLESDHLGGSEDATYLMQHVQERGGKAAYVGVGTDHPSGHHTETFDVDEESIGVGIEVLANAIVEIGKRQP